MSEIGFDYSNLSGRPAGLVTRALSVVIPGVREVQDQVVPYAERWQSANRAALAAAGPLWIALGDSMTQGIGASAFDRGWIGQLAVLAKGDVPGRLVNLSSSGAKVRDVLDRQLPAMAGLGVEPDLITVLIGSNDLIRPRNRRIFPESFAQMLDALPAGTVVATQPNPSRAAAEANGLLERAAAERGLVIAELRDRRTGSWKGKLAADHFHPNDAGYAGIAAVFADAVSGRRAA
ncbi:lysophospholipase L1-like esterase [Nakamurella sp. UYEF19]|uniref:SGNH/GDSL hydrolase family protein n=1 Tax=Nakamurella sp. UYEF19 TaxID=1756392 RepID=UPI0033981239